MDAGLCGSVANAFNQALEGQHDTREHVSKLFGFETDKGWTPEFHCALGTYLTVDSCSVPTVVGVTGPAHHNL